MEQANPSPPRTASSRARGRRHRRYTIAAVIVLGLGALVGARSAMGPQVEVVVARRSDSVQKVVMSGRVAAPARINVGSILGGTVARVLVDEGDTVKQGQALIQLDDAELRASVLQARAGVQQAQAKVAQIVEVGSRVASEGLDQARLAVAQAERKVQRLKRLREGNAATETDLVDAESELAVARSRVDSAAAQARGSGAGGSDRRLALAAVAQAQGQLAMAEARLAQARITAGADGVVLTRAVEPGDVVQAGRTLLVLSRSGSTHLEVQPDEKNLAYLQTGQSALASADAFPSLSFAARVGALAPSVDPQRGTVTVKLPVPAPPPYLRPDMTVSVEVEVARRQSVVVLPPEAVREAQTREPWVMRIADGHAERRAVKLGVTGEGLVEVIEGLEPGDRVLPPPSLVKAGQRVRAVERPAAQAGAGR